MTSNITTETNRGSTTLGELIHQARLEAGYTFKSLSDMSGVPQSQINKLEHDQVKKANPAHLAALADPLGLTLYQLYSAAGYKTPSALSHLSTELEAKLWKLPPDALKRLERYVESLIRDEELAYESVPEADQPGDA